MAPNPFTGFLLKILSTMAFTGMATMIKLVADRYPVGEIAFFRSFFALIPLLGWVVARGQFPGVFRTKRPWGHLLRSLVGVTAMFLGFAALARLPLADATAIGFTAPLMTVALAALLLGERVRVYRWSAVAVGFLGVLVIVSGYVAPGGPQPERSLTGALLGLGSAFFSAFAYTQIRRLTQTEAAPTIVVYFSIYCAAASLATLPLGWTVPDAGDAVALVAAGMFGGIGQVTMTQSFRHADASALAPFDYLSMVWALIVGGLLFSTFPTATVLAGTSVVVASGLIVVHRERQLGIARTGRRAEPPPPPLS